MKKQKKNYCNYFNDKNNDDFENKRKIKNHGV